MISILKTDTTWRPEQVNEVKYILRSNKTFTVPPKDFVDYDTGINLDFNENYNVVFKLYNNDSLVLRDNVLEFSNFLSNKSTIVTVTNYSNESITVRDTQYFLSFETIPKSHGNQKVGQIEDEQVEVEQVEVEVNQEQVEVEVEQEQVQVEQVQVQVEVEQVEVEQEQVEVEQEQVEVEQEQEQVVEPLTEPQVVEQKKRKYVKRKP